MMSNFVEERLNCDISDMRLVESVYYPKNPVDLLFLSVSLPRLNAPRWVSLRRGLMRASASHKARISFVGGFYNIISRLHYLARFPSFSRIHILPMRRSVKLQYRVASAD
jgi:hypothetical protein